jgi:hypothetical protein
MIVEKLADRSISVLGGEYLYWQRGNDYVANKIVIFALVPSSVHSKRIEVDLGEVPPPLYLEPVPFPEEDSEPPF